MIITDQKILRQVSKPFQGTKEDLHKIIALLDRELLKSLIPGVGLSAIQISLPIQVAIIRTNILELDLYNARILDCSGLFRFKNEGCLSIPNIFKDTWRFENITIENGNKDIIKLQGYEAVVVEHELDHQNGILFIDRLA
jgi:peptide deformylase